MGGEVHVHAACINRETAPPPPPHLLDTHYLPSLLSPCQQKIPDPLGAGQQSRQSVHTPAVDLPALAPMARPAIRHPSTSLWGSCRIISRSLHVPGSPSSALTTKYFGLMDTLMGSGAMLVYGLVLECAHWVPIRGHCYLPPIWRFVHETPLQATWKSGSTPSS